MSSRSRVSKLPVKVAAKLGNESAQLTLGNVWGQVEVAFLAKSRTPQNYKPLREVWPTQKNDLDRDHAKGQLLEFLF